MENEQAADPLDMQIPYEYLQAQAREFLRLVPHFQKAANSRLCGSQSDDFYRGMIAGIAASVGIDNATSDKETHRQSAAVLVGAISDILCRRGL